MLALFAALPAHARPAAWPRAEAEILALSQETIALRSVRGEGNRTADTARAFKAALARAGSAAKRASAAAERVRVLVMALA